ncbi:hypothetical protein DUI87_19748 [Hirundo rustica rustica]|uniref:Uncharacterized protein n=1 Tax=Hirundo rustica rustica TaxID=333673 RepID=A0A3M0JRD3_HIRRU|nr:hypothetical protein DUI87_19748 [Hirundo rustica rustica]
MLPLERLQARNVGGAPCCGVTERGILELPARVDVPERGTLGLCHSLPQPQELSQHLEETQRVSPSVRIAEGTELGGRQRDHQVQPLILHRQPNIRSLSIPGNSVQRLLELQQPQSCDHCSGCRALGKGPGPGLGLGQWPREKINLQLLPQSREEQELLLGETLAKGLQRQDTGHGWTLLGARVSWDVGMDLFPGRAVGPWHRVGGKAAAALKWLEVSKGWLQGTSCPEDMA